jgi:hypothetical protein
MGRPNSKPRKKELPGAGGRLKNRPRYELLEDDHPDIREELKKFFDDPEPGLDIPHEHRMGRKPRDLIGTDQEIHLRNLLRRIQHGIPT